ncbi:MAG: family oxidoreductase [Geminicoccaceae bacterium]|nr:family oxidoreductase [Geminicoccaceae bacterium]
MNDSASVAGAVAATVDAFGGLHVVSSNAAAITAPRPLAEMEESEWRRAMDVNVTGSFLVCKHAILAMIAAGGGSIILMASQMGRVAYPGSSAYCTTKGALLQLAKGIALDYVGHGIRANTFARWRRHRPAAPALSRHEDRAAGVGCAPSDGAARRARRGGASRAVPRLGGLELHDRRGPC